MLKRLLFFLPRGGEKFSPIPFQDASYAPWDENKNPENSLSPFLSDADIVIVAAMAAVYAHFIKKTYVNYAPTVLVGIDTRPTGPAIADIFIRVLIAEGCEVHYLFIVPAPEIMAYAHYTTKLSLADSAHADGFAYISASHNPPGYNGLKFGLGGGVLSSEQISPLIATLKCELAENSVPLRMLKTLENASSSAIAACYERVAFWKRRSLSAYMLFSHEVFTNESDIEAQDTMLAQIAKANKAIGLGVLGELNGSARTQSIDADWLGALGVQAELITTEPGNFVHRIVPERDSLDLCRAELYTRYVADPRFMLGYVPDCDGDRGNIVIIDTKNTKAVSLEAQEVFAIVCLSELSYLRLKGVTKPIAVVVNDATSMRIEAIAGILGARVFRAETGEANVVNCAEELRAHGWIVRMLGEGSNGGTIIHPSRVRDPLSTLGSLIRLLRYVDDNDRRKLFFLLVGCQRKYYASSTRLWAR